MSQIITDVSTSIDNTLETAFEAVKRSMLARALPGQHRYVVYLDHATVEAVPNEVVASQANDVKLKLNQFKAHLTSDVAPFNRREVSLDDGKSRLSLKTLEIHTVSNLEAVKAKTEQPKILVSWGEPDAQKRRDLRNQREGFQGVPSTSRLAKALAEAGIRI